MSNGIDISRYNDRNELLIGETMEMDMRSVKIFVDRNRFPDVRPGIFLIIRADNGGLIGYVGSKITKTKYGGEFIPIYIQYGEEARDLYGDIEKEYVYNVELYPLYEVDQDGNIRPSFTIYVKPHQPVYILHDDDLRHILTYGDEINLSFLLYVDLDDYIICRNMAIYLYRVLGDRYGLDYIFKEFLRYGLKNKSSIDVIINVFEEVSRYVE